MISSAPTWGCERARVCACSGTAAGRRLFRWPQRPRACGQCLGRPRAAPQGGRRDGAWRRAGQRRYLAGTPAPWPASGASARRRLAELRRRHAVRHLGGYGRPRPEPRRALAAALAPGRAATRFDGGVRGCLVALGHTGRGTVGIGLATRVGSYRDRPPVAGPPRQRMAQAEPAHRAAAGRDDATFCRRNRRSATCNPLATGLRDLVTRWRTGAGSECLCAAGRRDRRPRCARQAAR